MSTDVLIAEPKAEVDVSVVDCDIHLETQSPDDLTRYLSPWWRDRLHSRRGLSQRESYGPLWDPRRLDSYGTPGLPAGSEPDLVHQQLFREAGIDYAVILRHARGTVDPDPNA